MHTELAKATEALEKILAELEAAHLPVAAAHVSTAVELVNAEVRRRTPASRPRLRAV